MSSSIAPPLPGQQVVPMPLHQYIPLDVYKYGHDVSLFLLNPYAINVHDKQYILEQFENFSNGLLHEKEFKNILYFFSLINFLLYITTITSENVKKSKSELILKGTFGLKLLTSNPHLHTHDIDLLLNLSPVVSSNGKERTIQYITSLFHDIQNVASELILPFVNYCILYLAYQIQSPAIYHFILKHIISKPKELVIGNIHEELYKFSIIECNMDSKGNVVRDTYMDKSGQMRLDKCKGLIIPLMDINIQFSDEPTQLQSVINEQLPKEKQYQRMLVPLTPKFSIPNPFLMKNTRFAESILTVPTLEYYTIEKELLYCDLDCDTSSFDIDCSERKKGIVTEDDRANSEFLCKKFGKQLRAIKGPTRKTHKGGRRKKQHKRTKVNTKKITHNKKLKLKLKKCNTSSFKKIKK
jgi:hypothetical protein